MEVFMHAYSQDLRDRVLGALARGERPSAIAKRYEVSRVWVYQVKARLLKAGERSSRPVGGYRVSRIAHLEATVRLWIKAQPDLTLVQLCERLAEHQGIQIKPPALWHQLDKWQLSFKKNAARQRARTRRREAGTA
jgi:transposase